MRSILFILLFGVTSSLAETGDPTLTGGRRDQALRWLLSTDSNSRRKAHQALSQLGEPDKPVHQALLKEARIHHATKFQESVEESFRAASKFSERFRQWLKQCESALELGNQNLAYDGSALRKLAQRQTTAGRSYRQLPKLARARFPVVP